MTEFILLSILDDHCRLDNTDNGQTSRSITAANNHGGSTLGSINTSVKHANGPAGKLGELKDTSRSIPQDGLALLDRFVESLDTLLSAIQAKPSIWDTVLIGGISGFSIFAEGGCCDVVEWQEDFDVVLLCFLHNFADVLGSGFVEERFSNLPLNHSHNLRVP